jgi:hypothetical protein
LLQHRDDARHPQRAHQAQGFPRQCEPSRHPAIAGYRGAAQRPHSDQQIHYPSFNFQINLQVFSHEQPCSKSSGPNGTETALTQLFDLSGDLSGLADRDVDFKLPTGRGDEFAHGGGPDPRDRPKSVPEPRDIFVRDLQIDMLKVKARNFQ